MEMLDELRLLFSAERLNSDSSSEDSDDEEEGEQNGVDQAEVGVWRFGVFGVKYSLKCDEGLLCT